MLRVKVESEGKWVPRTLSYCMIPRSCSQVQKRLWTHRDWRAQWGMNCKDILLLPNIHEEVLTNSVCELVNSASKMGIRGILVGPAHHVIGTIYSYNSGLHLCSVMYPIPKVVVGNSWSPGIWGHFLSIFCWKYKSGPWPSEIHSILLIPQGYRKEALEDIHYQLFSIFSESVKSLSPVLNT